MDEIIKDYRNQLKEKEEIINKFYQFIGGMGSILTYETDIIKTTDKQRVSKAIKHLKELYQDLGMDFDEVTK